MDIKCISVHNQTSDCAICMTSVLSGTKTPCGHVFHNNCMQKWLGSTMLRCMEKDSGTCPMCRSTISDNAILEIEAIKKKQVFQRMLQSVEHYM